jgi:hypothetical protein
VIARRSGVARACRLTSHSAALKSSWPEEVTVPAGGPGVTGAAESRMATLLSPSVGVALLQGPAAAPSRAPPLHERRTGDGAAAGSRRVLLQKRT